MKVIVTGGAGFLGSYLCEQLLDKKYQVICIDNLLTGNEKNISRLKNNPQFKFLKLDVTENLPDLGQVDQIYHLASPASPNLHSPKSYHALPFKTMKVNTTGTWQLADLALKYQARLLFASTSEVYGNPLEHPQTEEYHGNVSTTGPRSVYDESKRFGETIVAAYCRHKNLDGRIIRIFNTYGPKMSLSDGRVVIEFMKTAKLGLDIPIFGDGQQTRSFCFVSDTVSAIIQVMESDQNGEVFNIGNPEEFTILELAGIIKELYKSNSRITYVAKLPEDDPLKRRPDISKIKNYLGWEPKVKLQEGLKILKEYLESEKFV